MLPQPTTGQQLCEEHTNTRRLHLLLQSLTCWVFVQVYRSVLIRRTPKDLSADENMEEGSASEEDCKISLTQVSYFTC